MKMAIVERLNENPELTKKKKFQYDKDLLSSIRLEPINSPESDFYSLFNKVSKFKPYYVAHTKIETLALLDEENKGSNWYQWRGRWDLNPRSPDRQSGDLNQSNRRPRI